MSDLLRDHAVIVMGQSPPGVTCSTRGGGLPLLNGPTEFGPHHPTPVQFTTDPRKTAAQGDLLFCVRGSTTGRMNWADRVYAIGRGVAAIRHARAPELQPLVRGVIEYQLPGLLAQATGSTFPNVSASQLAGLQWPDLQGDEERAAADILGALDDKIELNRRMSETLEAMARALFKSWFLDFDPMRAKAEGRGSGLPSDLDELVPVSFVQSDIGMSPTGWKVCPLSEQTDVERGISYKGSGLSDHGMPMHNLNSVEEGGGYKYGGIKYYIGEFRDRHRVSPGDCIVVNTEQGRDRMLIGHAAIVPTTFGADGLFSHHLYRIRPKADSPLTPQYLCHLLNDAWMHDIVSGYSNGTTVNMLPADALKSPVVAVPPTGLVRAFDDLARDVQARVELTMSESTTLAQLRDALLPKLISGELRVSEAERMAVEAGA